MDEFPKKCGCGVVLEHRQDWDRLPLVVNTHSPQGRIVVEFDDSDSRKSIRKTLEFRNCLCGSTMTIFA